MCTSIVVPIIYRPKKLILIATLAAALSGCHKPLTIGESCQQTPPTDDDHASFWMNGRNVCARMFLDEDWNEYAVQLYTSQDSSDFQITYYFETQKAAERYINASPYQR
jgi:hypothetical protein